MKRKVFAVLFAFAFVDFPFSQEAKNALLIANGIYGKDLGALMQPEREAEALKVALESIGFKEQLIKTRVLSATLQDYCQQRFKTTVSNASRLLSATLQDWTGRWRYYLQCERSEFYDETHKLRP